MKDQDEFFVWQEQALGRLLGWGAANVVLGAGGAHASNVRIRQVARQALGWGLVDLLLAINGRLGARRSAGSAPAGSTEVAVRRFRAILALNAVLDLGYIMGGLWLVRSAGRDESRKGTGQGIVLQGLFLACYDLLLLSGAGREWGD